MQKYNPGTLIEVVFPFEDSLDKKVRPVLIIKDYGDSLLVAKITSKQKGRKWDINIPRDDFNGLSVNSAIQVDKCIELSKSELCSIVPRGIINPLQLMIVKERLQEYLRSKE